MYIWVLKLNTSHGNFYLILVSQKKTYSWGLSYNPASSICINYILQYNYWKWQHISFTKCFSFHTWGSNFLPLSYVWWSTLKFFLVWFLFHPATIFITALLIWAFTEWTVEVRFTISILEYIQHIIFLPNYFPS